MLARTFILLALMIPSVGVAPHALADDGAEEPPFPWVRVGQSENRVLRMGVGYRTYEREGGPSVTLLGAVHIADPRYYEALEQRLEAHDLVLFEGVGPTGSGAGFEQGLTDQQRVDTTENRVRLLAILAEQAKAADGAYPGSLEALEEALPKREQEWVGAASTDAWGNRISYDLENGTLRIMSRGADGEPGGDGFARDLTLDDQEPVSAPDEGGDPGIQQRLAKTFGLSFQLDEMDTTGEKYINSDLSIDEVDALIRQGGGDGTMLFDLIGGGSLMNDVAGLVLGVIERLPGVAVRGKVMLMVMLGSAEEIFSAGVPGMEGLFEVLIERRNERVIEDLGRALAEDREYDNGIAIIYGAGHMADLETRLMKQFGYSPNDDGWLTAMRVDLNKAGISPSEMRLIRTSIDQQLSILRAQSRAN